VTWDACKTGSQQSEWSIAESEIVPNQRRKKKEAKKIERRLLFIQWVHFDFYQSRKEYGHVL